MQCTEAVVRALRGFGCAFAVVAWLGAPVVAQPANAGAPAAALSVTAATAKEELWHDTLRAAGAIEPWQEAVVGAQVGGQRIVEILAEVGDGVAAGQVLARFDDATLRAEEAELVAAVQEARAALAEAEANRERAVQLQARELVSEQDVLRQTTQAGVARAQLAAAEARLATKRLELSYASIVAPDAGVVSARRATLGAVAQPGEELFRLIRQSRLEWRGELTAQQLARVEIGHEVELTLPDRSRVIARVRQIAPTMRSESRLAIVYADLPPNSSARAGMYAEGEIRLAETRAVVVPAVSVVIRDGRQYVFALDGDEATPRVVARLVEIGRRVGDRVEVERGVEPGTRVVEQGAGFLNDGDVVRVVAGTVPRAAAN